MTVVLIVLAILAAYVGIGWWLAKRDMPKAWIRAREAWPRDDDLAWEGVIRQSAVTVFGWPVAVPARGAVGALVDAVDRADPKVREREIREREGQLREREAEIQRMERELGIGRTS